VGQVFVSYASADVGSAGKVVDALRAAGSSVFRDADRDDGIPPGASWQQEIFRQLRMCDVVVFLNSEASQRSKWCHTEVAVAIELGKQLYCVDLAAGIGPYPLAAAWQKINFESSVEDGIDRLLRVIAAAGFDVGRPKWDRTRPPYPGLSAMDMADAGVFFGRDDEIRRLVAQVEGPLGTGGDGLTLIVGPSGAGKSSLVGAGLAARMRARAGWIVAEPFEPGLRPMDGLVARLVALAPGKLTETDCWERLREPGGLASFGRWITALVNTGRRLLLIVDQAEQLATVTPPGLAREFLQVLGTALGADSPVTLVATARSDHFEDIQQLPVIGPLIQAPYVIAPMTRDQLGAIIEQPAAHARLAFQGGLASRLIDDATRGSLSEAVDALPLLAATLRQMYDLVTTEKRSTFTTADYEHVGRIAGVIGQVTQAAESSLPAGSGPLLDRLLIRFVTITEGRGATGRPVRRGALSDEEQAVVKRLEDQRLLTGDDENVRLAHEMLISAWPRLERVIVDHTEEIVFRNRIERQAAEWKAGDGGLLGRDATATARGWLDAGGNVGDFVRASARAIRRRRRLALSALSAIVALALVASVIAAIASIQRTAAISQSHIAQSEQLSTKATSLLDTDAPTAMLLSVAAYERAPTSQARTALLRAEQQPLRRVLTFGTNAVTALVYSADGGRLVAGDSSGRIIGWSITTWRHGAGAQLSAGISALAFSPGNSVFTATTVNGGAFMWYPATGQTQQLASGTNPALALAWSPDGRYFAMAASDGSVLLQNLLTGHDARLTEGYASSKGGDTTFAQPVNAIAFSPDGRTLAAGNAAGGVQLFDTATGRRVRTLVSMVGGNGVKSLAFSPDGKTLAVAGYSDDIRLLDVAAPGRTAVLSEASPVNTVAFSKSGELAAGTAGGTIGIWDAATRTKIATYGEGEPVNVVTFSPDGRTLAAADDGGRVAVWDASPVSQATTLSIGDGSPVTSVAFNRDGTALAAGDVAGAVGFWNPSKGRLLGGINEVLETYSTAFSPDRRTMAVGWLGGVDLWNVTSFRHPALESAHQPTLMEGGDGSDSVAFSPDGTLLAVGDYYGGVGLWDVATRHRIAATHVTASVGGATFNPSARTIRVSVSVSVNSVAFSPDGKTIAIGDDNGEIVLWSVTRHGTIATMNEGSAVNSVAFSPDGTLLAAGDAGGHISLWGVADHQRVATLPDGSSVGAIAFTRDGRLLASGDTDGDVDTWDPATRQLVATVAQTDTAISSLAISPDGAEIAAGGYSGTVTLLASQTATLSAVTQVQDVCRTLDWTLNATQWDVSAPGIPYEKPCP
jgi:WD40 repeat protein